jgi:hypothetical protein
MEVRVLPGKATPDADDSAKRIGICCQTLRGRCYNNTYEGLTLPTPRQGAPVVQVELRKHPVDRPPRTAK